MDILAIDEIRKLMGTLKNRAADIKRLCVAYDMLLVSGVDGEVLDSIEQSIKVGLNCLKLSLEYPPKGD